MLIIKRMLQYFGVKVVHSVLAGISNMLPVWMLDDFFTDYQFPDTDSHSMAAMGPSRLTLDKPVIAAIAGPAVAGGMELALFADIRVMETSAYMGVFSRRWGIPLIDGGTVRLPRLVGEARAMDIILTGRKLDAEECLRIGLCEYVVDNGKSRQKAEELAHKDCQFSAKLSPHR